MKTAIVTLFALTLVACASSSDPAPAADAGPSAGEQCCADSLVGKTESDACCLAYMQDAGSR